MGPAHSGSYAHINLLGYDPDQSNHTYSVSLEFLVQFVMGYML